MNPPHLLVPSPESSRQSQRSGGISVIRSSPDSRCAQNSSKSSDPGITPAMPTMATGASEVRRDPPTGDGGRNRGGRRTPTASSATSPRAGAMGVGIP